MADGELIDGVWYEVKRDAEMPFAALVVASIRHDDGRMYAAATTLPNADDNNLILNAQPVLAGCLNGEESEQFRLLDIAAGVRRVEFAPSRRRSARS